MSLVILWHNLKSGGFVMYCIYCGSPMDPLQLFCGECGAKKKIEEEPPQRMSAWYYIRDGIRSGPYDENQMTGEISNGNIHRDTLVWKQGLGEWMRADMTSLSRMLYSAAPPVPAEALDNRYVWALATIPLFVSMLLDGFFGYQEEFTLIVIILNVIFLSMDIKAMESGGKKPESWVWLGIVLIPVYLFLRASKTDKNYAYGFVWCAMFLIDLL